MRRVRQLGWCLGLLAVAAGLAVVLAHATHHLASAATCTDSWVGNVSGSWGDRTKWSTNAPPTSSDDACLPSTTSGAYTVAVTIMPTVHSLTVGSTSGNAVGLAIEGVGCASNASLAAASNVTVQATGSVTLTTIGNGSCPQSAGLSWSGTLTNIGTITSSAGPASGFRYLRGALTSSGTVNISTNTSFDTSGAAFTNTGSVNVATGATLALSSVTFTNNGSIATAGTGALAVTSGTFNQGAGSAGTNPVTLASSSALNFTGAGAGSFAFTTDGSLSGNVAAGQQVIVEAQGCATNASVSAAAVFTNAGSIILTTVGNGSCQQTAGLSWPGTLTNTGTITTSAGSSNGPRNLTGTLLNSGGTVAVGGTTNFSTSSGTFTNSGAVNVNTGAAFTITSTTFANSGPFTMADASTVVVSGGTFTNTSGITSTGSAAVSLSGATFNQGANSAGANPVTLGGLSTLNIAGTGAGSFAFTDDGTLGGNIAASQQVAIDAMGCATNANVTAAAAFSNAGSITVSTINNGGCSQTAGLSWPGTLTSTGTITVNTGVSGGPRYLRGTLASSGTINVNTNTSYDTSGATLTNSGTVNVASAATLTMSSTTFTNSGSIATVGSGTVAMVGGIFNQGANTAGLSAVTLAGSSTLNLSGTGPGTFDFIADGSMSGNIAAAQQVGLDAIGCASNANVSAAAAFSNAGSITLTTTNNSGCAQTAGLSWPGTLTNSGMITSNAGVSGGARYLRGNLSSTGTVNINVNTSFDSAGTTLTNKGTANVGTGATLTVSGATFTNNGKVVTTGTGNIAVSGGTFNQGAKSAGTNPVTLSASSTLHLVGAGAGIFAFTFDGTLSGNIATSQQVEIEAIGCATNANVSATAAFTNAGAIT